MMSKPNLHLLLALSTALLAPLGGCSGGSDSESDSDAETSSETDEMSLVDVPAIEGDVEAADFCALADEITCAGALGCCEDPEFAGVDACVEQSRCAEGLGLALASDALKNGELIYDAAAAGEFLRQQASSVASCTPQERGLDRPTFLRGSRGVGEDCTPVGDDITNMFTCADGLQCDISIDPDTQARVGTCGPEDLSLPPGAAGTECASSEDCGSGVCTDGACAAELEDESPFCVAPVSSEPPSNATPTHLYIDLNGTNSGSSGDVTLTYSKSNTFYRCKITDTLSDGQEKVCAVSSTGNATGSSAQFFDVEMSSNDGIRVDTVCACSAANTSTNKCTSAIECAGTFNEWGTDQPGWCSGGSFNFGLWSFACKRFWLDGDGNGNCTHVEIDMDSNNNITCES